MKKLSSFLLSVLVLFGIVANDMSFVSAMNTEKVTLTSEKEEIEINEKTNLKAYADLSQTAEIIDYKWTSDNEETAIVSGEMNSAVVEAKAAGKAKITVTVNYKNKVSAEAQENINSSTAEIEINVVERKPQDIVTAKKESSVEKTDDNLDPVTAEYIKNNLDAKYTSNKMMRLDQVLVVKNTLVEASGISENETIDSFFLREDAGDLFITTIPALVALYNFDENSKYYVGLANTMINDKTAEVRDQIFAINNNNAELVNDKCHYDPETGLVYISKDLFGNVAGNVQVQFLQAINQSVSKLSSKVTYSTTDNTVKEGNSSVDGFDFETNLKTEKNLDKSELTVSVNGLPTNNFNYDSDNGIITIPQSSIAVQSANVDVDKKSPIAKLADKFLNITNVEAFSMGEMGCAGTVDVPDGVGTGWSGQISLYKAYASDWKNATLPVYGLTTGEADLMNTIYYGGQLDYNKLYYQNTAMYLGIWIQGGLDTTTGIWHNSFWNWTAENVTGATQLDAWLRLQCTHLSNPDTAPGVEWKDEMINVRVLDKTGDEIVVGFLTKRVNSQSGAGIAKFKIKPKKGNLNITKVNGNPELTDGNDCYSLAGAEYQLRDGSGNTVATLITDVNGNASVSGINAGNYTLVETKASPGFELNTEHTSVTINAGQTTTLNGIGCLVEQPANDPVAIQITKADMDSAESSPQGNASLEGAEFTIKYYNALYDKQSDLPEQATRTWVLKTKKQTNGTYKALMLDSYKVSGDDFYREYGIVTLPIGTITVQETKAPNGYLLDGATLVDGNGSTENIDNGIYLTQIIQNDINGSAQVTAGNFPIVKDEVKKHHIEIEKVALDHEGNTAPLNGAEFTIKLKSDVSENGWDNAETYDVVTTANIDGKDGQAVTKDLPFGTYILRETGTPSGYVKTDDIEFTIDKDISETSKIQHITVTDTENHVRLYKYDVETDAPLRRAEYLIYNVTKDTEVGRYQTDDNGIIDLYKLDNSCVYYAQEVNAPNGYEINNSKFYFEFDRDGYVHVSNMNGSDVDRSVFTINDKGDMTISLNNKLKWFKLNVVKKNDADKLLAGAEFTLYKNADCTDEEVMNGITDDNGNLLFEKVEVGTYWIKETKAPAGYRKLLDPIKVEFKCIDGKHVFVVNDVVINDSNSDENYSLALENDWYVGNMTVVNQRGSKLPATGSKGTIILAGAGVALCLAGLNQKRKNNKDKGEE